MKKKRNQGKNWLWSCSSKIYRIMRLICLFMLVALIQVSASTYSQTTKLSLTGRNLTIEQALGRIEDQSEYSFFYNVKEVDLSRIVNVEIKDKPIEDVLNLIMDGTGLTYTINNKLIIIHKRGDASLSDFNSSSQQNSIVSGRVTDAAGAPLPGVTVTIKGTASGTITDASGNYTLKNVPPDAILLFSFVGMENQEVQFAGQRSLDVTLQEETIGVDEVVVVGYSVQKKSTLTGAVSPVNVDDMQKRRVAELSQALQGQVAGVQVTQSTGAPGDEINVRIRGEGTIGNNNPLYVIDGVPTRELNFLNPADIQSMTVLKDASAAAIYGSRASAGVIIITTKSGEKGKSQFDINYYRGIQNAVNLPKMLNANQYMNVVEKAWNNAGYTGTNPYTADKGRSDFADTDWLDEVFEQGYSQDVQLTASGGNEKLQYLLSTGYYDQNGIVVYDNDKYQRYNFRANINADLTDRIRIGTNLQLSYAIQDKLSSKGDTPGIIRHALLRPPVIPVYKDSSDPTWSEKDPFTDLPFYIHRDRNTGGYQSDKYEWTSNPVALAYFTDDKRSLFKTFGNLYGEVAFLKDKSLKFKTSIGVDLNFSHNKAFYHNFGDDDGQGNEIDAGTGRQNRPNGLDENRGEAFTYTWNNTLNFIRSYGKHAVNALVGSEFIDNYESSISASRRRYEYDTKTFTYIDFGSTEQDLWNGGSGSEWALLSFFTSATYVYDSKYMLTANFRADASSRFAEDNRWGYFPSLSAGWKLS